MPIGVTINVLSVVFGGIFGTLMGNKLPARIKDNLTLIFGVCAIGMGIVAIDMMKFMPAVILAVVLGTIFGFIIDLNKWITTGALSLQKPIAKWMKHGHTKLSDDNVTAALVTIVVLFCASGSGIYGSIDAGMTGDSTILISKSILDFFTAAIFACNLGIVVSMVAIPQFIIFGVLALSAQLIFPLTTPDMIGDFKACGGFLLLATGFRMTKIKEFPVADMIPAMVIVMPISWIWANWIVPLITF